MKVYHLHQRQTLPFTIQEAWDFFSNPVNLAKITPASMQFKILHISGNGRSIYPGQIMSYRIKVAPFITVRWITEITHVQPLQYFVDDQRFGPYAFWHHQHHFKQVSGGVEMIDEISYAIPLGFIGRLANTIFVARKLKKIFDYRYEILQKTFPDEQNLTRQLV